MVTYTDLENEMLAEIAKHDQRKANTLGPDGLVDEEPFGSTETIYREDIWSETPTALTGFPKPDYRDNGDLYSDGQGGFYTKINNNNDGYDGYIATRYVGVRLFPLVTSGKDGPTSIQSFVAIFRDPQSDNPEDIEASRIKRLVSPNLSPGRGDAAITTPYPDESWRNRRGFELALYPAKNIGGRLYADTAKQIPTTADPSAQYGIGSNGRWFVDYSNGIVRLTAAPLNGPTGLFNPNSVYGDLKGNTTTEAAGGRITLFATFYRYTGATLVDADDVNVVTVGDGYASFGTFYGTYCTPYGTESIPAVGWHDPVMQQAINSLGSTGGTVYLKPGVYRYNNTVIVPKNVRIVGLSKNAIIFRCSDASAFAIRGSRTSISGIQIRAQDRVSGSDIELRTDVSDTEVESGQFVISDIEITNNILSANTGSQAIVFSAYDPTYTAHIFRNIKITDNKMFCEPGYTAPIFITDWRAGANAVTLHHVDIVNNDFGDVSGTAISFSDPKTINISELHVAENHTSAASMAITITLPSGTQIHRLICSGNSDFGTVTLNGLLESTIENCRFDTLITQTDGISQSKIINNYISTFTVGGTTTYSSINNNGILTAWSIATINASTLNNNTVYGTIAVSSTMDEVVMSSNRVLGTITFNGALTDCSIIGNTTDGAITTNASITRTNISSNVSGAAMTLQGTGAAITNLIANDNTAVALTIQNTGAKNQISLIGNKVTAGALTLSSSVSGPSVGIKISDNIVSGSNLVVSGAALSYFTLTHNTVLSGYISVAQTVTDGTIIDNMCSGVLTLSSALTRCRVDGNTSNDNVIGVTFGGALSYVDINANIFSGPVNFNGTVDTSNITTNTITGIVSFANTVGTGGSVEILGNSLGNNLSFAAAMGGAGVSNLAVNISNNISALDFVIGSPLGYPGGAFDIANIKISNNTFNNFVINNTGTKTNLSITDNRISSVVSQFIIDYNTLTDSIISGNIVDGYLSKLPALNRVIIANNNFDLGALYINGSMTASALNDNRIHKECVVQGVVSGIGCKAEGNIFKGTSAIYGLRFNNTVTDMVISDNQFAMVSGGKALSFALDVNNISLSGNKLEDTSANIVFEGNASGITVTGNMSESQILVIGTSTNVVINSNTFTDISLSNAMVRTNIIGNSLLGSLLIPSTTLDTCNIQSNTLAGILDIRSSLTRCNVNGNIVLSTSSSNIAGTLVKTEICNNIFNHTTGSVLTIGNYTATDTSIIGNISSSSGSVVIGGSLTNCKVTENEFVGPAAITGTITASEISENKVGSSGLHIPNTVTSSQFSENIVDGYMKFLGQLQTVGLTNNMVTLEFALTSSTASTRVSLLGNNLSDISTFGGFTNSTFVGNIFQGATVFGTLNDTTVCDNNTGSALTFTDAYGCTISNNTTEATFTLNGLSSGTEISSNRINSSFVMTNPYANHINTSISGNSIAGVFSIGTTTTASDRITVSGNIAASSANIGKFNNSSFVGNTFLGQVICSDLLETIINANSYNSSSDFFISTTSACNITGNTFEGLLSFTGNATNTTFGTNYFKLGLSLSGSSAVNGCTFGDNKLDGILNFSSTVDNTTIVGNTSSSALHLHGVMTNSVVESNYFGGGLSNTANIINSSIISNDFDSAAVVLLDVAAVSSAGLIFDGNISLSNLTIGNSNTVSIADLLLINNKFATIVINNSGSKNYFTISNNETSDGTTGLSISGSVLTQSTVSGNTTKGLTSFTDILTTTLNANNFEALSISTTAKDSSISDNTGTTFNAGVDAYFGNDVFVGNIFNTGRFGQIENCLFNTNEFVYGKLLFNGAVNKVTLNDNIIGFGADGTDDSIVFGSTVSNSEFNGNIIAGEVLSSSSSNITSITFDGNQFTTANNALTLSNTSATVKINFVNNRVLGYISIGSILTESVISGNYIKSLTLSSTAKTVTMVGNDFYNPSNPTLTVTSPGFSNSTIGGNSFFGTVSVYGLNATSFVSNNASGTITITSSSNHSAVSSNTCDGALVFDGYFIDTAITGNSVHDMSLTYNSNPTIAHSSITGNAVGGNFAVTNAMLGVSFTGNTVEGTTTFSGALYNATEISSNSLYGNCSFVSGVDGLIFTNNGVSALSFANVAGSTINGNRISGAFSLAALTDSVISGNSVYSSPLTITGAINYGNIVSNHIHSIVLPALSSTYVSIVGNTIPNGITAAAATYDYRYLTLCNNTVSGTDAFKFEGSIVWSSIDDNIFNGKFTIDQGGNWYCIYESSISNNTLYGDVFVNNDNSASNNTVLHYSNMNSNEIHGNTLITTNHTNAQYVMSGSNFDDNNCTGTVTIKHDTALTTIYPTMVLSTINDNSISSTFIIDNDTANIGKCCLDCTISNNILHNVTFGANIDSTNAAYALENTTFVGNTVVGTFTLGSASRDVATDTYFKSVFGSNVFEGNMIISGRLRDCVYSSNTLTGSYTFTSDDLLATTIKGNNFGSNVQFGACEDSVIGDNDIFGTFTLVGTITDSTVSNNHVAGTTTTRTLSVANLTGNIFAAFNTQTYPIADSKITGNIFSTATINNVDNVIWSNNRHSGAFTIEAADGATISAQQLNFTGNLCEGLVKIDHPSGEIDSGHNIYGIYQCSFNSNTLMAGLQIGYSDQDYHKIVQSVFNNNCGAGDWNFNLWQDHDFTQINIMGNNIDGALNITFGDPLDPDIWVPGNGSNDTHMIALNYFSSYGGETWKWATADTNPISWGHTVSGSNVPSNR